jgi:hypothetical protein
MEKNILVKVVPVMANHPRSRPPLTHHIRQTSLLAVCEVLGRLQVKLSVCGVVGL